MQHYVKENDLHFSNKRSSIIKERKQKHPRINMAFYGDNLDYVRESAYESRLSITEYVNRLIAYDRQSKNHNPKDFSPE